MQNVAMDMDRRDGWDGADEAFARDERAHKRHARSRGISRTWVSPDCVQLAFVFFIFYYAHVNQQARRNANINATALHTCSQRILGSLFPARTQTPAHSSAASASLSSRQEKSTKHKVLQIARHAITKRTKQGLVCVYVLCSYTG